MTAQSSLIDELERALAGGSHAQRDDMLLRIVVLRKGERVALTVTPEIRK